MAIDVKNFQPMNKFKKRMKQLANGLRAIYPTKGYDEVMVAGDPEKKIYKERTKKGIPLTPEIMESFSGLAKELNIRIEL